MGMEAEREREMLPSSLPTFSIYRPFQSCQAKTSSEAADFTLGQAAFRKLANNNKNDKQNVSTANVPL